MASAIGSILRAASRDKSAPLNILDSASHERYGQHLAYCGNHHYIWNSPEVKEWNTAYNPVPTNFSLLDKRRELAQIPDYVDFDLGIIHSNAHLDLVLRLRQQFHINFVGIEHTWPLFPEEQLAQVKEVRKAFTNVFITEKSRAAWGYGPDEAEVVYHCINSQVFQPKEVQRDDVILTVGNEMRERDVFLGFSLFKEVTKDLPVKIVGNNQGISQPARNLRELIKIYNSCKIYFCPSQVSPIPLSLMEAASMGCAIVSADTCGISEVFTHGYDAFLSNKPEQLREYLLRLLQEPKLAEQMGSRARRTIVEKFTVEQFTTKMNRILNEAAQKPFIG